MKNLLIVLVAITTFASACSQKLSTSEIPAAAQQVFKQQFPQAKEIKWEKENDKFEVNFEQNDMEMSALISASGVLEETEAEIKKSELLPAITNYISQNYAGEKIKETTKITKANGEINYEAEVKGNDLIFDATGKFIKSIKKED